MSAVTPSTELRKLCSPLELSDDLLQQYMEEFKKEIKLALSENHSNSSLKCSLTYVQDFPTGDERGQCLALDFSGATIKVALVTLKQKRFDLRSKQYTIPRDLTLGPGEKLFDFLANSIFNFTHENKINSKGLPLGFSFGFLCEHKGIKSALLSSWSKGINCPDVIGSDVVARLQDSIAKIQDLNVEVSALINDSTATLLSCMWKMQNCKIGVIIDCGFNICYIDKTENVMKFDGDDTKPFVLIDTEISDFGRNGQIDFVRCEWDRNLDELTQLPGRFLYDKMISRLYMGELVRQVLISAVYKGIIFKGRMTRELTVPGSFNTMYIIDISKDWTGQNAARTILKRLGYQLPSTQDCVDLAFVCNVVWTRASHLAAASVASIINYLHYKDIGVGFDGIFYHAHPGFSDTIRMKMRQLVDPNLKCVNADDRGGLGAALAAYFTSKDTRTSFSSLLDQPDNFEHEFLSSFVESQKTVAPTKDLQTKTAEPQKRSQTSIRGKHRQSSSGKKVSVTNENGRKSQNDPGMSKDHSSAPSNTSKMTPRTSVHKQGSRVISQPKNLQTNKSHQKSKKSLTRQTSVIKTTLEQTSVDKTTPEQTPVNKTELELIVDSNVQPVQSVEGEMEIIKECQDKHADSERRELVNEKPQLTASKGESGNRTSKGRLSGNRSQNKRTEINALHLNGEIISRSEGSQTDYTTESDTGSSNRGKPQNVNKKRPRKAKESHSASASASSSPATHQGSLTKSVKSGESPRSTSQSEHSVGSRPGSMSRTSKTSRENEAEARKMSASPAAAVSHTDEGRSRSTSRIRNAKRHPDRDTDRI